jgi:hypothetical protein
MSYIDLSDVAYSDLNQMAVYAQGALKITQEHDINVTNGYWYGSPVNDVADYLKAAGSPSGLASGSSLLTGCVTELETLISTIAGLPYTPQFFDNNTVFFTPGVYTNLSAGITYTGKNIIFDAGNNPNAQFFLKSTYFAFTNTTFELQHGARPGNVFWIALDTPESYIEVTNSTLTSDMRLIGILITRAFTATSSGSTSILLNGHIFSQATVNPSVGYGLISLTNSITSPFVIKSASAAYENIQNGYIDLTSDVYQNLNQMTVYAQGALNASTTTGSDSIFVSGGFWAGNPVEETPLGSLDGGPEQSKPLFLSGCADQLATLIQSIYAHVTSPGVTPINNTSTLFTQGTYYDNGSGIDYPDSITLTFDAQWDPNAQFFLWSDYHFTFPNTKFVLTNGARAGNVFFVATSSSGYITITNSTIASPMYIPCIMIATTVAINIIDTATEPLLIEGAIFSQKYTSSVGGDTYLNDNTIGDIAFIIARTFAEYDGVVSPTYVDLSTTSPNLSRFAILAVNNLTTLSSIDTTIHVKDGYWYGGTVSSTPALVPEGALSGYNNDPAINPITYQDEFNNLTGSITKPNVSTGYPGNPITNTITTFYPNFYYSDDGVTGLSYDNGTILTFDAKNIPNAQFFINAQSLLFAGTRFNLINGAIAGNIFWITSDSLSFTNSLVPGIILSIGNVGYNITDTDPTILSCHIYSKQSIDLTYTNVNTPSTLTIQAAPLSRANYIDLNDVCPNFIQFAVLSIGTLVIQIPNLLPVIPVIVKDGYWYGNPTTSILDVVGGIVGTGVLSGLNPDPYVNPNTYTDELDALLILIDVVTAGNVRTITNTTETFLPGYLYQSSGNLGLEWNGKTLIFDAGGNPNAQFFISAFFFNFTNVSFNLINGAKSGNIFWKAGSSILGVNSLVPGIIMSFGVGNKSGVNMIFNETITTNCHLFSKSSLIIYAYGDTNQITIAADPVSPVIPPTPAFIDLNKTCPNSVQFTILSIGALTTSSSANPDPIPIHINKGYWYGDPVTSSPSDGLVGDGGPLSGFSIDPFVNQITYTDEFIALLIQINDVTTGNEVVIDNTITTFYPGYFYKDNGTSGLEYGFTELLFDALGNPDAQFFIGAAFFNFNETQFSYINGAKPSNIFWLSINDIIITNSVVSGIILSLSGTVTITLDNITPISMLGHIFTYGNITLDSSLGTAQLSIDADPVSAVIPPTPAFIDLNVVCPKITQFAVASNDGPLTTTSTEADGIIIKNGYWYGAPVSATPGLTVAGLPYGPNNDIAINPTTYTDEISSLSDTITSEITRIVSLSNSTLLFYPEYLYKVLSIDLGLEYGAVELSFDALGNPEAQFFITADYIRFNETTFVFRHGANPSNIFWLSMGDFNVVNSEVPGFISVSGNTGVITIDNNDNISRTLLGHIFTNNDINLYNSGTSQLTIEASPVSTIINPYQPPYIDINTQCPLLVKFAVLSASALNITITPDLPITIENGYWYGNPVTSDPLDGLVGTGVLSGFNNDPAIHPISYENEYNKFVYFLINDSFRPYKDTITTSTELFYPEYLYQDDGTGLVYDGQILTFNANGNPDAQFLINAAFFRFTDISFELINGATAGNIFWLTNGSVTIIDTIIPGVILATGDVVTRITMNDPYTMNGHIFSLGSISIDTRFRTAPLTISSDPISINTDPIVPRYIYLNATCPDLIDFAVLTVGGLSTTTHSRSPIIPVIIKDGYWYGSQITTSPPDCLVGEGRLSGFNGNPSSSDIYINQLDALIAEIASVTNIYLFLVDNTTTIFYPGYLYIEDYGITGFTYENTTLTFDAGDNPDAQFFLNAAFFAFSNVSFSLINGAKSSNIFWLADNYIETTDSLVPGILMGLGSDGGVEVRFSVTPPTHTIMNCHIFAKSKIILDTSATPEQLTIQSDPIPPTYIDLEVTCPRLLQFAVISQSGVLTARAPTNTPTIIDSGYWFGNPVDSIPDLLGEGVLNGYNNDPVKHSFLYQIEINALVDEVFAVTSDNIQPLDSSITTFYPQILYRGGATITYDYSELTFDARGDPKAQFFIIAGSISIIGTSFRVINQAQPGNIFWVCDGIDVTNSSIPGILLADGLVSITLDNSEPMTLNGHIFTLGNVELYNIPRSGIQLDSQLSIISNPVSNKPPYPPFPTIDLNKTYPNLVQFSVISRDKLFTSSPDDNTRPVIINDGHWFGNPVQSIRPILSSGLFSGYNNGPALNPDLYNNELDVLRAEIFLITLGSRVPINRNDTFYPQYLYVNYDSVTPIPNPLPIDFADIQLEFDAGGDPNAQFFIHGLTITFTGSTFSLINGAQPSNIFWVSDGYIGITNSSVPGIIIARGETENDGVEVLYNDPTTPMTLRGHIFSRSYIYLVSSVPPLLLSRSDVSILEGPEPLMLGGPEPLALTLIAEPSYIPPPVPPEPPVVCYAKGTLILTKNGYVPIENMKAGDKVITNGKIYKNKNVKLEKIKTEPVLWVGKFKVNKLNTSSRPICITKNSLAKNFPFQDLYVSPNHSIIIDGEMVLAKDLVNEITIYQDNECEDVEYYHLECENHSTVIANGIVSESYLNMDNRSVFENSLKIHRKKYVKPEIKKILLL